MPFSRRTLLLASTAPLVVGGANGNTLSRINSAAAARYRGVNLSGAEFTADAAHLPGVADRDYRYPTRDDLRYVASRGHAMVRLPVRWERIQPVLAGPLRAAELRRLTATVDQAAATGLRVLVDLHNYARFIKPKSQGGTTLVLGDGQLADAHLVDLWSRLSTALKGSAGVLGYGLMNEPHDLPGAAATPGAATSIWAFDGGSGSWVGEADARVGIAASPPLTREGRASLCITRRLAAGRQHVRANDGGQRRLDPTAGQSLSAWVYVPRTAPGARWTAQLEMQDASYHWHPGPSAALTPGTWARISCTPEMSTWDQHRGVGVQFSSDQASSVTVEVFVDSVHQHRGGDPAQSEARQWERTTQLCVDAIRANRDATPVFVSGVAHSGAQNWPRSHPEPWVRDRSDAVVYEAHYYFDRDNTGTYVRRFSDEDADARARGYVSLRARALSELGQFLTWCRLHRVPGFIGELGWDGRRDSDRWNAVGKALYAALDAAGVGSAYWAAGQWYGSTYNLSVYTGTPLGRRAAPAAVVEAYPGRIR